MADFGQSISGQPIWPANLGQSTFGQYQWLVVGGLANPILANLCSCGCCCGCCCCGGSRSPAVAAPDGAGREKLNDGFRKALTVEHVQLSRGSPHRANVRLRQRCHAVWSRSQDEPWRHGVVEAQFEHSVPRVPLGEVRTAHGGEAQTCPGLLEQGTMGLPS